MLNMKKTCGLLLNLMLFIFAITLINCKSVQATETPKKKNEIVLRSANLSTDKTIKVPNRTLENKRLSRGGSESTPEVAYDIVDLACTKLGSPYVWAATGPEVFDCSGFTKYVFSNYGIDLPHYTGSQIRYGKGVSRPGLEPGDLVFFNTDGYSVSHVGIYTGNGQFIHAASGNGRVIISDLGEDYYSTRYVGARRMF